MNAAPPCKRWDGERDQRIERPEEQAMVQNRGGMLTCLPSPPPGKDELKIDFQVFEPISSSFLETLEPHPKIQSLCAVSSIDPWLRSQYLK